MAATCATPFRLAEHHQRRRARAAFVIAAVGHRYYPQLRSMGALHRHATVEASKVRVSVEDGKVTIEGSLDAHSGREAVRAAVRATPGVRDVVDKLVVASI